MPYIPATATLAAAHKGRIGNIRAASLRESKDDKIPEVVIVTFETESVKFDEKQTEHCGSTGIEFVFHVFV